MKADHSGAKVICPYYVKEANDRSITCEGMISYTDTTIRFSSPKRKLAFKERHCDDFGYLEKCPMARAVASRYTDW